MSSSPGFCQSTRSPRRVGVVVDGSAHSVAETRRPWRKRHHRSSSFQKQNLAVNVAHAIQSLTDLDNHATVMSIDGISAFDLISRAAMLDGLSNVRGGVSVLPFVRQFHTEPSQYFWTDDYGVIHSIHQGGSPCCSLQDNMGLENRSRTLCKTMNTFSLTLTICVSSVFPNVSPPSSRSSLRRWRSTRGPRSIWAKRKCGTGEVIIHQDATFYTVAERADPNARV